MCPRPPSSDSADSTLVIATTKPPAASTTVREISKKDSTSVPSIGEAARSAKPS
jgi:hypothetical protein